MSQRPTPPTNTLDAIRIHLEEDRAVAGALVGEISDVADLIPTYTQSGFVELGFFRLTTIVVCARGNFEYLRLKMGAAISGGTPEARTRQIADFFANGMPALIELEKHFRGYAGRVLRRHQFSP